MTVSLDQLGHEWQSHPLGRNRALGGLRALNGFAYQLAVSLEQFIDMTLDGDDDAVIAFETLSDLSRSSGGLIYLIQVKATLSSDHGRAGPVGSMTSCVAFSPPQTAARSTGADRPRSSPSSVS